ncbi:MAG TPA: type II toxin-antitoxin system RelE/ParE family toxin [Thiomicrospira sp.]|nr:type II toxin-antitoxin system RelE/ParE family toxin [Thiomicrospira sp.]
MQLVIQNKAKEDIKQIYYYSLNHFGERKADEYYVGLTNRMEEVCSGFVVSSNYSHIRQGLRRTNYESHAIYYRINDQQVIILRVLGQSQDSFRHL